MADVDTLDTAMGSATTRRTPWPLVLCGGLLAGLAWGVFARVWMRFISTDPEFSWSGTLFIVVGFGIAGTAQAGAYLARRRGLSRRPMTAVRVVTTVGLLPLGMAAGGPLLPTILLAPLAITHRDWNRYVRSGIGILAVAPLLLSARPLLDELSIGRAVTGTLWFVAIYAGIVWAARFSLAPQLDGWRAPRVLRAVGVVGTAAAMSLFGVMAVGL